MDDGQGGDFQRAYTGALCSAAIGGLASGLPYRFRLRALNSEGSSLWSPVNTATTSATTPSSPVGLAALGTTRTSISLAWRPPSNDGGSDVLNYLVQLQAKAKAAAAELGPDWILIYNGPATACTFSGLQVRRWFPLA
jgi:hypothetical protein